MRCHQLGKRQKARGRGWRVTGSLVWEKYPQFGDAPPEEGAGPVMAVEIDEWAGSSYQA